MKKEVKILVIPVSSPLLVGVYDNENNLIETRELNGKTSDLLPLEFANILKEFEISELFYVKGPGSYMAIKVCYIFLKSLSIVKNIDLKACEGFEFNENSPIKALGKKYFFKAQDGNISIEFLKENDTIKDFQLPKNLDLNIFTINSLPNYNLPAVS